MKLKSFNLSSVNKSYVDQSESSALTNSRRRKFTDAMRTIRELLRRFATMSAIAASGVVVVNVDGLSTSSRRPRQRRDDP